MTNIFISQPMNGKTDKEIVNRRKEIEKIIIAYFNKRGKRVNFIPSFIENASKVNPVFCLGLAITNLSYADVAVFCDDWINSRGCRIEREVCKWYGIYSISLSKIKKSL